MFSYLDRSYPHAKMEVVKVQKARVPRAHSFIGQPGEINTEYSEKDLLHSIYFEHNSRTSGWGLSAASIHSKYGKSLNAREGVEFAEEYFVAIQKYLYNNKTFDYRVDDWTFISILSYALEEREIPYELLFTIPKNEGELDDILSTKDLSFAIRIKKPNSYKYQYFYPFQYYSTLDDRNFTIAGKDGFAIEVNGPKLSEWRIKKILIPPYTPEDNVSDITINARIAPGFQKLVLTQTCSFSGEHKTSTAYDLLSYEDFKWELEAPESQGFYIRIGSPTTDQDQQDRRFEKQRAYLANIAQVNQREANVTRHFEVDDYKDFDLESTGMEQKEPVLSYKEKFTVTDLIKHAGDSAFIVEVGKLITPQVTVNQEEYERVNDVYVDYPQTFSYRIVLIIPKGYTAKGIEQLNRQVKTEGGSFTTTATIKGNRLIITTSKQYTSTHLDYDEWREMTRFFDEAFNFYYAKVLIAPE